MNKASEPARGYAPSDGPADPKLYGQDQSADDIAAVLKHLETISKGLDR